LNRLKTYYWFGSLSKWKKINLSTYLSEDLSQDYSSLSKFSEKKNYNWTLFYCPKNWKAKELLVYDELSLSEIAIQLNYSNVAYLSSQFKSDRFHAHTFQKKWREYQKANWQFINVINGSHNCVTENGHLSRIFVMLT
jgi:hypothetical protein